MCRLTAVMSMEEPFLLADILTRPQHSIVYQSFNAQERSYHAEPLNAYQQSSLNADGFGVGWYTPYNAESIDELDSPCVYTSMMPAWNDMNLHNMAEKTCGRIVMAHVRAAVPLGVGNSVLSCHPFRFNNFLFMHNGNIGNFLSVQRALLSRLDDSTFTFAVTNSCIDSVVLFALFLSSLPNGTHATYTTNELRLTIENTFAALIEVLDENQVTEHSLLNIVVSDGFNLLATRFSHSGGKRGSNPSEKLNVSSKIGSHSWAGQGVKRLRKPKGGEYSAPPTLYFASGTKWKRQSDDEGDYKMLRSYKRNDVAIITSEPLTLNGEEWVPLPRHHMIIVASSGDILITRLDLKKNRPLKRMFSSMDLSPLASNLSTQQLHPLHIPQGRNHLGHLSRCHRFFSVEQLNNGETDFKDLPISGCIPTAPPFAVHKVSQIELETVIPALTAHTRTPILCSVLFPYEIYALHPLYPDVKGNSRGNYIFTGNADGGIEVWDTATMTKRLVLRGHTKGVLTLKKYVANQRDLLKVGIEAYQEKAIPGLENTFPPSIKHVRDSCITTSEEGFPQAVGPYEKRRVWLFSGSSDTSVCIWDVTMIAEYISLEGTGSEPKELCFIDNTDFPKMPVSAPLLLLRLLFSPHQGDALSLAIHVAPTSASSEIEKKRCFDDATFPSSPELLDLDASSSSNSDENAASAEHTVEAIEKMFQRETQPIVVIGFQNTNIFALRIWDMIRYSDLVQAYLLLSELASSQENPLHTRKALENFIGVMWNFFKYRTGVAQNKSGLSKLEFEAVLRDLQSGWSLYTPQLAIYQIRKLAIRIKTVTIRKLHNKLQQHDSTMDRPQFGVFALDGLSKTCAAFATGEGISDVFCRLWNCAFCANIVDIQLKPQLGFSWSMLKDGNQSDGCERHNERNSAAICASQNTQSFMLFSCTRLTDSYCTKHCGFVEDLVTCGDYLCSAGGEGLIFIWKDRLFVSSLVGHEKGVLCLQADSTGSVLYSGSRDKTIRIWNMDTFSCRRTLTYHSSEVLSLAMCGPYLISTSACGEVYCWSSETYTVLMRLVDRNGNCDGTITSLLIYRDHGRYFFNEWLYEKCSQADCSKPVEYEHEKQRTATNGSEVGSQECYRVCGCGNDAKLRLWLLDSARTCSLTSIDLSEASASDIETKQPLPFSEDMDNEPPLDRLLCSSLSAAKPSLLSLKHFDSVLRTLVSMQTVSISPETLKTRWECARCISFLLKSIGSTVKLVDVGFDKSPIVLGRLGYNYKKPTIVLYSHYDVIPADTKIQHEMNADGSLNEESGDAEEMEGLAKWKSSPWELTARDGYYYGRGVSDNKGPFVCSYLAAMSLSAAGNFDKSDGSYPVAVNQHKAELKAAATTQKEESQTRGSNGAGKTSSDKHKLLGLHATRNSLDERYKHIGTNGNSNSELPVNLVWICEGEEENGSTGLAAAVRSNIDWFTGASCVLCTNGCWIDDKRPCLVYGMRGVIDIQIEISAGTDPTGYHSGVHGGALIEPIYDLLSILSSLVDADGKIRVPGFYDDVKVDSVEEEELLKTTLDIECYSAAVASAPLRSTDGKSLLRKRLLEPVISVTEIVTSSQQSRSLGKSFRIIPSKVTGNISLRFVPNQSAENLVALLKRHCEKNFLARASTNTLSFKVVNGGRWWLENPHSDVYRIAEDAVRWAWGRDPLYLREGGTMPVLRDLQEILAVPTLELPLGQASDAAHLPNERMRIQNIYKGITVLQNFFDLLGQKAK